MLCNTTRLSVGPGHAQSLTSRPAQTSQRRSGSTTIITAARRNTSTTTGGADLPFDAESSAIIAATRRRIGTRTTKPTSTTSPQSMNRSSTAVAVVEEDDFVAKVKAAWRIFFPEKQKPLSPKEEGKKRLRMILVADRCGMSSDSLVGMRESIVRAMENFVEVESDEAVEVNLSMDPEIGTIYSVAVPVRRVKPTMRPAMAEATASSTTAATAWDPNDPESDPSDQFPYGT